MLFTDTPSLALSRSLSLSLALSCSLASSATMKIAFRRITKEDVDYLLTTKPTPKDWIKILSEWREWHAKQVGIETQNLDSALDADGPSFKWWYYLHCVHLHETYVQLYQALIGAADATIRDMFDQAKDAEALVDFSYKKWRQSTYHLEMTAALEAAQAKREAMPAKLVCA